MKSTSQLAVTALLVLSLVACTVVAKGLPEAKLPQRLFSQTPPSIQCKRDIYDRCERGTVVVPAWLTATLRFQHELNMDTPLDWLVLPSSHNSAISFADGYGWFQSELSDMTQLAFGKQYKVQISNQWISLTDQLNSGIRSLELDTHWYEDHLRICHAGGVHLEKLDMLIEELSRILHVPIDFDSETIGCFALHYRTVEDAMTEIKDWLLLHDHDDEIVYMFFDDNDDLQLWDRVNALETAIDTVWSRDMIFTPTDKAAKFPERWPSTHELLSMGKRVLFWSGASLFDGSGKPSLWFNKSEIVAEVGSEQFVAQPKCGPFPGPTDMPALARRFVTDGLEYGPFYNGSDIIDVVKYRSMTECAMNLPALEFVDPSLVYGAVFSWEDDFWPVQGECAFLNAQTARWRTAPCSSTDVAAMPFACQSQTNRMEWMIASTSSSCSPGYYFSAPIDGLQNLLALKAAGGKSVRINVPASLWMSSMH